MFGLPKVVIEEKTSTPIPLVSNSSFGGAQTESIPTPDSFTPGTLYLQVAGRWFAIHLPSMSFYIFTKDPQYFKECYIL